MITYNQLFHFVKTIQCGSISKAAEEMFVAQPAVSNSIKKMEDELHVKLFNYQNKLLTLTSDGEEIYQIAAEILNAYKKMEAFASAHDEISSENKGICYYAPQAIHEILTPQLRLFDIFPNYSFSIYNSFDITDFIFEEDSSCKGKFGIYLCPETDLAEFAIPDNYNLTIISSRPTYIITSIDNKNPILKQKSVRYQDVVNMPFVRYTNLYSNKQKRYADDFKNIFVEMSNISMLHEALRKNPSSVLLGGNYFLGQSAGKLKAVPIEDFPKTCLILVYKISNDLEFYERLMTILNTLYSH